MSRLEIVHLRLAGPCPPALLQEVLGIVDVPGRAPVRVFRNATVSGDFGVHLEIPSQAESPAPSELGLRLAAALRERGIVEHTVWIELKRSS